jgi:hypothetical protein
MPNHRVFVLIAFFSLVASLAGCAAGGGFMVIPPEMEKATVADDKYQGVHAVYLYDIGYVHFDPFDIGNTYYPSYVYTRYAKIKLLTRAATEGGRYGNIIIRHVDELLGKDAYVMKPDGTRQNLTAGDYVTTILVKDIIPDAHPPIHFYETQIIFPGLDAGDTIVYQYTMRGRELMWDFNHVDAPVLYSKFMAARPLQRSEIQPVIYDRHNLKPEKSVEKGIATGMAGYVGSRQAEWDIWEARNVPPISGESAIPPAVELASRVRVWQGDRRWDWGTLGTTYYKWFTHYGRYPSVATDLGREVTKGIVDPRLKAKAIHDWVKKNLNIQDMPQLTYVPRAIEISRFDVDDLLKEKDANPERAASLMWLMMQAVGVEATLVLAVHEDYPPALEDLPYLYQFTHPLLALDDGTLIDTTNRLCPFGMIPWEFEGRKGLWIKGESVSWQDIPTSRAADNKREIKVAGEVEPEGNVKINAKFSITGQMAYAYRRFYAPMKPKEVEDSVREIAASAADKAEVDRFEFKNIDDVDKPLEIDISYKVPRYADVLQDRMVMKAGAFAHHTSCPILAPLTSQELYICPKPMTETRENPVKFPFARLDEMDIGVVFPKTMLLQALPKGFRTREIDTGTSLGVQTSYGSDGGKNLHVVRKFSINQPFVDKKGYPKLRDMLRRYEAQKDTLITLELPKLVD